MIAIPAIDLIQGRCVRLTEGAFDSMRVYSDNPEQVAQRFAQEGAERLHVVDLDAARGKGNNRPTIRAIRKNFPGILDVGGGIRRLEDVQELREIGVDYLVLGSILIRDPQSVIRWASNLGPIFVAGIDARDGMVRVEGWETSSTMKSNHLARRVQEMGLVEIIHTDIGKDGTLAGPNISESFALTQLTDLPVIISGGVGALSHLEDIADQAPQGIKGVILGKALYEDRLNLSKAIKVLDRGRRI